MIECRDITFRYREDGEPALNKVNLSVTSGESVCIMGANGSGKSTLAKLVAGLVSPAEGTVTIGGDPAGIDLTSSTTGILFQNPDNQMVAMVVDKEVAFALENKAIALPDMEDQVDRTITKYRIDHLRNRLTAELSGGEKQRVALAAATVFKPKVLVLDEPDSFLDAEGRQILRDELASIRRETPDMIEIRVTQYPQVARTYPRLLVMQDGEIIADGRPSEIFKDTDLCVRAAIQLEVEKTPNLKFPSSLLDPVAQNGSRPASVRVDNLSFGYSESRTILKEIELEMKAGETLALVGPTGSGKSSLGLLLCSLLKPVSGRVSYLDSAGKVMSDNVKPGWVSGVLQLPERQFFLSTSSDEVAFGPRNLGKPLADSDVRGYLELVGLNPDRFSERDPFSLSVGEKRRLAFAAVLSMSPAFVVFDEPTASLDQEGIGRFISLSRTLKQRNIGQLVISHEGDVVQALADRVLCLDGQGGYADMTPAELFASEKYSRVVSKRSYFAT